MPASNKVTPAKILIVDDDVYVADTVKEFLETEGFQAIICNNGAQTLDYLRSNRVDLILLDLILPHMDGIELAQKIKADNTISGFVPIIIISAKDSEEDKVDGLRYADDYLTKPFSFDELIARIKVHLRISLLQNELFLSKTRYQYLYENMPEMCISLDRTWKVSDCNMMFSEYFTMEKCDVIGKSVLDFFHTDEHEIINSFFNTLRHRQISSNSHIFQMVHPDNRAMNLLVSLRAVHLGEHTAGLNIIVSLKDMTLNIKLEKQEKLARQQLYRSARLASIGTLASGTAHEMNNPLAAILGFADAMLHRLRKNETVGSIELEESLSIIKSETLRCRDVVENLSKFSRDYESQSEKISLYDCLHSAVSLMNVRAQKKHITIDTNIPGDAIVNADAQKIGQVVVNILSNAIDFCNEGSTIIIAMESDGDPQGPARVTIKDNGPGISQEVLPKIFDPFFTTKEIGKGVGLGMSISHKLMEECKGSIDVLSKENKGTTVILEIPRD